MAQTAVIILKCESNVILYVHRLVIETPVKIFPPSERFWYYSKRPLVQQFYINLKEASILTGRISKDHCDGDLLHLKSNVGCIRLFLP